MSSKIDERIVGMKFNGDQFQKGVADTSSALDKLKAALNFKDAGKGLQDVDAAAKNFSLANMAQGVSDIAGKFGALSVIGITALANIANKAVDAGLTIARSLTIDPIKAGFAEYELKMGSIQTILSNTARFGTQLPEVTANLDELNKYADKTIYNFGDMTKNIGLFTNAGIGIGDATTMIKGFSNEAAASGTSSQGAAGAAYQLSQALSAGTIRLMDWRSLQNVGMGNKNMQNGLIEIAQSMGKFNDETTDAATASANFNGSLEHNWLSADVMSNYLKIMAEDTYDSAKAMALSTGLSDEMADSLAKQAVMSNEAATKVRTFTQLMGTMRESVGSGWSETFDLLIGDFNQATDLWTAVNNELGGILSAQSKARNDMVRAVIDMGGRDRILESFANIWDAFQKILMPIQSAWKEIFPPVTPAGLIGIINAFKRFTDTLAPSADQMKEIKRTFMGLFAVLDIGWMVLQQIVGLFGRLFGAATEGAGGILGVTANVGDFLVKVRDAIKNGTALEKIFKTVGDVLQWPIDKLRELGGFTMDVLGTWDFANAWEAVANAFRKVGEFLAPVWEFLGEFFANAKQVIGEFFKTLDFNVLVGLLNVGALTGIGIVLKQFFDKIMKIFDKGEGGGSIKDKIKEVFGAMTDTFGEMQNTLKAASLIGIATAIALLVASVVALSFVDTGKLFISLGAMTIMFGQLSAMLLAIDKLTTKTNPGKMIAVAIALGALAGAMLIMSTAVLILSTMDWEELARGMAGLAVGLGLLVGASALLQKMSGRLIFAAPAMVLIAGAMLILATALKIFSTMSWEDMARAGAALAGSLGIIVGAMTLAHSKVFAAASMVIIAVAVNILAAAMKVFSTMSWDDILRAGVAFAGSMAIMVGALALLGLMSPMVIVGAGAMVVAAAGVTILAGAMKIFAQLSWDEIVRALVAMAGGLAILAGAMALMGIPLVALGGLALFVVSAGMMMLAPALAILGTMSWDAIGRGLTMLGASLAILAVGGLLLIPASVGFLLFGVALLMIGGAVLMAGQGLALFAAGMTALIGIVVASAPQIVASLEVIAGAIPVMMQAFAQGLIDFALTIANGATEFTMAATTLIQAILMGIQNNGPMVIDTIWILVQSLVNKVVEGAPFFIDAAVTLILALLNGINNQLPSIIAAGTRLIITFIQGIGNAAGQIAAAGADTVIKFVNSLANTIESKSGEMRAAGLRLATAIIDGMTGGIFSGASRVISAAADMAGRALNAAKKALGINSPSKAFFQVGSWSSEGMAIGLEKSAPMVSRAAENVGNGALTAMQKSLSELKNAVATDIQFNPTIKPILDLSAIRKDSTLIGGMLTPPTLKVDDSYAYAASIASTQREYEEANSGDDDNAPSGDTVNFIQNNYSPKALGAAEIYRQTNNQLSIVKKGQPSA